MPSASAARSYNAAQVPTTKDLPVAVFVGGTSGIGRAMASAFATHTNGRARIVIVGRNQKAAEDLRATLPSPAREQLLFIPCDMKLMRNVAAATRELAAHGVDKINYLVLSSGVLPAEGRIETEEGIDEKLAIAYYGRWKFVYELQEALAKAAAAGEPAKVLTVLAAGAGGPIELDDLGLKKNYGLIHTSKSQATYTDLLPEEICRTPPRGVLRTRVPWHSEDGSAVERFVWNAEGVALHHGPLHNSHRQHRRRLRGAYVVCCLPEWPRLRADQSQGRGHRYEGILWLGGSEGVGVGAQPGSDAIAERVI